MLFTGKNSDKGGHGERRPIRQPAYATSWLRTVADQPMTQSRLQKVLQGIQRLAGVAFARHSVQFIFSPNGPAGIDRRSNTVKVPYDAIQSPPEGYHWTNGVDVVCGVVLHQGTLLLESQEAPKEIRDHPILSTLHQLIDDMIAERLIASARAGLMPYLNSMRRYYYEDGKILIPRRDDSIHRVNQLILSVRAVNPPSTLHRRVEEARDYLLKVLDRHEAAHNIRGIDKSQLAQQLFFLLFNDYARDLFNNKEEQTFLSRQFVLSLSGIETEGSGGIYRGGKQGEAEGSRPDRDNPSHTKNRNDAGRSGISDEEPDRGQNGIPYEESRLLLEELEGKKAHRQKQYTKLVDRRDHSRSGKPGRSKRSSEQLEDSQAGSFRTESAYQVSEGRTQYRLVVTRPPIDVHVKQRYMDAYRAIQPAVILLQNRLAWANMPRRVEQVGLKTGALDQEALYRARFAVNLFQRQLLKPHRSRTLDLALLIDRSTSMGNPMGNGSDRRKIELARQLGVLFTESMSRIDSVLTWGYAFTQSYQGDVLIDELYSPYLPQKLRMGAITPGYLTPEYEALKFTVNRVMAEGRRQVQKVFLVLSDAQPHDYHLSGYVQREKIARLVRKIEREGHRVIHLTLDPSSHPEDMYPHFIPFSEGYAALVARFSRLLKKLLEA